VEAAGEGTDTVSSTISYALTANVENLVLAGSAAINGTGNELNNVITGNGEANVLSGAAGDDRLLGGGGADTLDGGVGADTLIGGLGDDRYVVENAGDVVTEAAGEGTDTVSSTISYVLGANLENLELTGSAAINGTGNGLNNSISGNSAANVLDGGAGIDTMAGGLGDDRYIVDSSSDVVIEAANSGIDTVLSSATFTLSANVENLQLTGSAAIDGTGNELDNTMIGNALANRLSAARATTCCRAWPAMTGWKAARATTACTAAPASTS
jgi:Ca2+-binding RTX toxin-like protein